MGLFFLLLTNATHTFGTCSAKLFPPKKFNFAQPRHWHIFFPDSQLNKKVWNQFIMTLNQFLKIKDFFETTGNFNN